MSFSLGIIGLPNVGKSTLFNALTRLQVEAVNYPFATIEPNVGVVPIPDERLERLAKLEHSAKTVPTVIEFNDIAGLVKDAHKGAGLGNQFLSHIREVDAIVEIVRCFPDPKIIHVEGAINPKRDMETVETELALADLQLVEKKLDTLRASAKGGRKDDLLKAALGQKFYEALSAGKPARKIQLSSGEEKYLHEFPLLTFKPILYIVNDKFNLEKKQYQSVILSEAKNLFRSFGLRPQEDSVVIIDAQLEAELAQLAADERQIYLKELGLSESGLETLIKASYKLLGLITFFTAGPKETRAWTCRQGARAPAAAGIIHSDFEKGFIKAEVINWQTLLETGGWNQAKDKGLLRQEGKDYVVRDGDVAHFRFNV